MTDAGNNYRQWAKYYRKGGDEVTAKACERVASYHDRNPDARTPPLYEPSEGEAERTKQSLIYIISDIEYKLAGGEPPNG